MKEYSTKFFRFNRSDLSRLLTVLAVIWLLWSLGLSGLVNTFLILFVLFLLVPISALLGLRWWLNRNLIQETCPVCSYQFTAFNHTQTQCPNCGEPIQVENGHFQRLTPPGTIDISAVEVGMKQLED